MIKFLRWSRSFHRWIAYGAGAIVGLWAISGVVMILPAAPTIRALPPAAVDPTRATRLIAEAAQALPADHGPVRTITLRDLGGRLVYHFQLQGGGNAFVDAATAQLVPFNDSLVLAIARRVMIDTTVTPSITRLAEHDVYYSFGVLPAYRIELTDGKRTLLHVAADGFVSSSSTRSRFRALMGGLHEFQLPGQLVPDRPRRALLLGAGVVTVALVLTGYVLVIPMWRRKSE